jgi:hypothetical protein
VRLLSPLQPEFKHSYTYNDIRAGSDYEQIGLSFKLYPAEVLFNRGLCLVCLDQVDKGLADLEAARRLHATKDHEIIGDAIRMRGRRYTVFSIVRSPFPCFVSPGKALIRLCTQPRGVCYRPSEKKLANAASKDYMGEAVRPSLPVYILTFNSTSLRCTEAHSGHRPPRHHHRFRWR